ncbi:MAG: bifunctional folylpolyglutamate synthase/dihydrofolate synthase [Clostridia bacterium]|nr:bifunctional folylpolyglutamate synthase/dihydrofolate synthase [Clostridia bacterium]
MTYDEALAYIHSVCWKGSRPGLSRITALLAALGDPQNDLRFVHIAGTNGKGSTSAMTESVLRAAGYRTGLFTSPFIRHFNERIAVNGVPISDEELAAATAAVKPFAEQMEDAPTEFELITAIGLVHFKRVGCDVVVLETGMGGRLDSTNIIRDPLVSVITGIAMDHTAFLGDTVEAIAAEKAGIVKAGAPVVWGGDDPVARRVIEARAMELGAPFIAAQDTPAQNVCCDLSGTVLDWGTHKGVRIPLLGLYQPQNLATVLAVLDALRVRGLAISERAEREGLAAVRWRGRFERLSEHPLIFSDGAHNPQGIAAAVRSIRHYFKGARVLLFSGVMADKDYTDMIRDLASVAQEVFTVTPDNPRALAAADYAEAFRAAGVTATAFDTVGAGVAHAVARAKETGLPLVSLGSLYLYCEFVGALEEQGIILPEA